MCVVPVLALADVFERFSTISLALYVSQPHKAPESFVWAFLRLNKEMFVTNAAISTTHAWSSSIQQWIFDLKGVLYFSLQQGEEDKFSSVYLLGNVCVLWPAVVAVLLAAYGMLGSVLVEEMKHRVGQVRTIV